MLRPLGSYTKTFTQCTYETTTYVYLKSWIFIYTYVHTLHLNAPLVYICIYVILAILMVLHRRITLDLLNLPKLSYHTVSHVLYIVYSNTHAYTHTCTRIHTQAHTRMHTHTHNTHTHTHTPSSDDVLLK